MYNILDMIKTDDSVGHCSQGAWSTLVLSHVGMVFFASMIAFMMFALGGL